MLFIITASVPAVSTCGARTTRPTLPCNGGGEEAYVIGLDGAERKIFSRDPHLCEDIEQRRFAHIWQPNNPYLHSHHVLLILNSPGKRMDADSASA